MREGGVHAFTADSWVAELMPILRNCGKGGFAFDSETLGSTLPACFGRSAPAVGVILHAIAFEFSKKRWPRDAENARRLTLVVACLREGLFDRGSLNVTKSNIANVRWDTQLARTTLV